MAYSILVSSIIEQIEPTTNLFNPTTRVMRYVGDSTIKTFSIEAEAISYASNFLGDPLIIVLPGDRDGLELYDHLWMGDGEECLQDLEKLNAHLLAGNYNWEYGKDDSDELQESVLEFEMQQRSEPLEPGETPVIGSYSMDNSNLVKYKTSSVFLLSHHSTDIEFTDLTPEEQEMVITEDSKGKAVATISMGAMFDLWCLKKFNGNEFLASLYATMLAAQSDFNMKTYRCMTNVKETVSRCIKKFNQIRINKGWV